MIIYHTPVVMYREPCDCTARPIGLVSDLLNCSLVSTSVREQKRRATHASIDQMNIMGYLYGMFSKPPLPIVRAPPPPPPDILSEKLLGNSSERVCCLITRLIRCCLITRVIKGVLFYHPCDKIVCHVMASVMGCVLPYYPCDMVCVISSPV